MIHKKVLILSTYPIKRPQHGGQKRTKALCDAYKTSFAVVRHSAVFYKGFYSDYDTDDIALGREGEQLVRQSPLTGDIVCGEAIVKDPRVKRRMSKLLLTMKPDIIHIEQPFPYLGLKPLLQELNLKPKLVFGSQNIEAPMKREILEGVNAPETSIKEITAQIAKLEADLSESSDLVVACTKSDMAAHEAMGARNLVLAQNGTTAAATTEKAKASWSKRLNKSGAKKIVLFVGSAHPPNWTGFFDMVGKGLGFIPGDTRIVIAGSICDYFDRTIQENDLDLESATFWLRAFSAGRLSEEDLGALIKLADVIILPITEGGGSNLKTAEAILADKKIVATSHALRSFEWFRDFPNLWIADSRNDFQESILKALGTPYTKLSSQQTKLASQVEWRQCLADMMKSVSNL